MIVFHCFQEQQKNELKMLNDQMKNMVDINEYKTLKQEFDVLTAKHREILHLVLFKVFIIKNKKPVRGYESTSLVE